MSDPFPEFKKGVVLAELVDEHVALVTLNRPEARNAVNAEVTQKLDAIVRITEAEDRVRAVVLRGSSEKVFSAGADLREVSGGGMDALYSETGGFAGIAQSRRETLWIAAVRGFALAGGFEIVLACDMVVASDDAQFGLPEVGVGLLAAAGGAYRLPRRLPRAIAIEMLTTTSRLNAARALELGLVNRVVASTEVDREARELALAVCSRAPLAVRESLAMVRRSVDQDERELHELSMEAQARLQKTEDFAEGPRAFLEKRSPVWKGR